MGDIFLIWESKLNILILMLSFMMREMICYFQQLECHTLYVAFLRNCIFLHFEQGILQIVLIASNCGTFRKKSENLVFRVSQQGVDITFFFCKDIEFFKHSGNLKILATNFLTLSLHKFHSFLDINRQDIFFKPLLFF